MLNLNKFLSIDPIADLKNSLYIGLIKTEKFISEEVDF